MTRSPLLPAVHRFLAHIIVAADLCYSSRFYLAFLPDFAQRILLSTILLVATFYIFLAVLRGHALVVLISVLCIGLVVGQAWIFAQNWNVPLNWTGIGQYSFFLSFVPGFIMTRDGAATYLVRTIARYALAYTFIYILISLVHSVGLLPAQASAPLLLNDVERGDRLFSHPGALAFAWYVAMVLVRQRSTGARVMILVACAAANVLTLSRVYLGCLAVVTLLSTARASRPLIRTTCFGSFAIMSSVLVYGMLDTRWNPFFTFASTDTSGLGRALEYQTAQEIIARSPTFGMGLSSFADYHSSVTGISYFAPGDLGLVGVLLDYGLIGTCLFIVASLIICTYNSALPEPFGEALFLLGCTFVLDSSIAPNMFSPNGTFYFLAIFGIWLAHKVRPEEGQSDHASRVVGSEVLDTVWIRTQAFSEKRNV